MTLPATLSHVEYIAGGSSPDFAFPFKVSASSEIEVRSAGSVRTENSDYTASINVDAGGTISFVVTPLVSTLISIRRITLYEQLLLLISNGSLPAKALEFRLDQIVKMIQQLDEELSRRAALVVGIKTALRGLVFPSPGAGKVVGWDALGETLTLYPTAEFQVAVAPSKGIVFSEYAIPLSAIPGAALLTATAAIPSARRVIGVTYFCDVAFGTSGGLTSVDIGGFGLGDFWGHQIGITLNTTTTVGNFRSSDTPITTAATDLVVTANGGLFDATGHCILTVHTMHSLAEVAV